MTHPIRLILPLPLTAALAAPAVALAQPDVVTSYTLPPDVRAKAEALYRTRAVMLVAGTIYGFATIALLLGLRVAPRFRDLAERVSRRPFVQALVFAPATLAVPQFLRRSQPPGFRTLGAFMTTDRIESILASCSGSRSFEAPGFPWTCCFAS